MSDATVLPDSKMPDLSLTFVTSKQLGFPVQVKINRLEGSQLEIPLSVLLRDPKLRHLGSSQSPTSDLFVTAQLWTSSKALGVPTQTPYKNFKSARVWDEWLKLPLSIKDAPLNTLIAITIWDLSAVGPEGNQHSHDSGGKRTHHPPHCVPFGGTTISLFAEDGSLREGLQKCKVHRHRAADGLSNTSTPFALNRGKRWGNSLATTRSGSHVGMLPTVTTEEDELDRLEKLLKQQEMDDIPRVDWLDRLTYHTFETKKQEAARAGKKRILWQKVKAKREKNQNTALVGQNSPNSAAGYDDEDIENFNLYIEFPRFNYPVVFEDYEYSPPTGSTSHAVLGQQSSPNIPSNQFTTSKPPPPEIRPGPEIETLEDENSRLVRIYDPEIGQRGNPCEDKHRRLVRSSRTDLIDRDLKPNAKTRDVLNKIMAYEPTQEMTSEEKDLIWKFRHHLTRDKRALTKFVKSVNWEDGNEARQAVDILPKWSEVDVDDALELLGPTFDNPAVRTFAVNRLRKSDDEDLLLYLLQLVQALKYEPNATTFSGESTPTVTTTTTTTAAANGKQNNPKITTPEDSSLMDFLIARAVDNPILGNYFHWYLMVECDDTPLNQNQAHRKLFSRVEFHFMNELEEKQPEQRKLLLRQGEFIAVLSQIAKEVRFSRTNRPRKVELLNKFLAEQKNEMFHPDRPLSLPLDPSVKIVGYFPQDVNVFKSSLSPLLLPLKTADGKEYPVIFKVGDDMRQDQLVIQIISLMDRLLRKENLDLKLTPYRILATSANAGAVQFIQSTSLSAASAKYRGSILAYLRDNNPDDTQPLGVRKEVMDTYIKSCAGYCVITYLLGVGDRHLDNLLLSPDGHFFHADFGFILGHDPKPFAPMMKLCKEMVEGMGGASSSNYMLFKQYCFTAYTTLRKSANLILSLFSLMVDANIPDIKIEPDKAVLKVLERFHLEMSEEEAIRHFEQLISDSVNAIFGVVIDRLHDFVQGWRA